MEVRILSRSWKEFRVNNTKEVIVINVISSMLYLVIVAVSAKISSTVLGINSSFMFQNESLILNMLIVFFCGLILVFYTTILPFFMNINIHRTVVITSFTRYTSRIFSSYSKYLDFVE